MNIAFSNPNTTIATAADIISLTALLNSAYRGERSKQGWTTEQHLISGETRTNEETLQRLMQQEDSIIVKYTNDLQEIVGCVNLQKHGDKIYLGMLAVSPHLQGLGIGKYLLKTAEEYAGQMNCKIIYMSVISVRTELINWYLRHGYIDTGERKPFIEDIVIGRNLQPLEFIKMEKVISNGNRQ